MSAVLLVMPNPSDMHSAVSANNKSSFSIVLNLRRLRASFSHLLKSAKENCNWTTGLLPAFIPVTGYFRYNQLTRSHDLPRPANVLSVFSFFIIFMYHFLIRLISFCLRNQGIGQFDIKSMRKSNHFSIAHKLIVRDCCKLSVFVIIFSNSIKMINIDNIIITENNEITAHKMVASIDTLIQIFFQFLG